MTTTRRVLKVVLWILAILVVLIVALGFYVNATWDNPIERPVREMQASMDSVTITHGEFLYKNRAMCWMCHSADGAPKEAIAKMVKAEIKHLGSKEVQAKSDADLRKVITEGYGKMKAVKTLADKDAANVIAYVRTLTQK